MQESYKISPRQLLMLVTLVTIGDSVLVLPGMTAALAKQDAWISVLIGLVVGLLNIVLLIAVGKLYRNQSFFTFVDQTVGRVLGTIITLSFISYTLFSAGAHVMEIGDFVGTHLLVSTPRFAIQLLFIIVIMFGVSLGLQTVAESAEIYFVWFFFFFVLLMITLLPQAEISRISPVFENGWKPILQGSTAAIAFPYSELVIFMAVLPFVSPIQKRMRSFFLGTLLGGIVLFIIMLMCILVLGADQTARHFYPTYVLIKQLKLGDFIQRLEAIIAVIWFIAVSVKITLYCLFFHLGIRHVFRIDNLKVLIFPYIILLMVMSTIFSPNMVVFGDIISKYWPFYDFTYSFGVPLVLLCGYLIRKKWLNQN
ncbi:endospore germination permease [Brevibacillus sp. HB1.2]|uniref:GerAB/ArcD/ProY family transporter n=1 Tax=Brevibacillus sp. HB1.2 TaxID=2738807 RepID=UPI001575509C|nr:endospore germination permease [Brevibacillus sp. HB1.2]NTU21821.1 endospore germination permease [Brevibacillus sp. HB1.2]